MKGKFFFCKNKHHIGVVHVPSFHLSARSSSFFCAFFLHFYGEPFYGSPDIIISSDRGLRFPATSSIRSFHRAANSLFYGRVKPDKHVLMRLLYSNCVPILTYGCAVKEYSAADMLRCNVALNKNGK